MDAQKQIGTRKKHQKVGNRNISGETAILQRLGREAVCPLVGLECGGSRLRERRLPFDRPLGSIPSNSMHLFAGPVGR